MCGEIMCEKFEGSEEQCKSIALKANRLKALEHRIAKLKLMKEALEQELITDIDHHHDGQITYEVLDNRITIKTTFNYRVDKEKFEELKDRIPEEVIRVETKYTPVKKYIKEIEEHGGKRLNLLLSEFLTKTEAKPSVKVCARV